MQKSLSVRSLAQKGKTFSFMEESFFFYSEFKKFKNEAFIVVLIFDSSVLYILKERSVSSTEDSRPVNENGHKF